MIEKKKKGKKKKEKKKWKKKKQLFVGSVGLPETIINFF